MNNIPTKNITTERLELRIPTMKEQKRLWEILCMEEVNSLYFPTPTRIYKANNLLGGTIEEIKKAREIFIDQLSDWEKQKPFYEAKIKKIEEDDENERYGWSIFLKGTDTVIGKISCHLKDNEPSNVRDLGWYIDPKYQGKGYTTEAAIAMVNFMFNEVEITDIYTSAADINPASWRIMETLGCEYQGLSKSTYIKDDELVLCKNYHLNKELFLNRKKDRK